MSTPETAPQHELPPGHFTIEGRFRVNTYNDAGEITGRKSKILTSHPLPTSAFSIPQDELFSSHLEALTQAKGVLLPEDPSMLVDFLQETVSNRASEKAKPQCHLEQDVFSFFFGDPGVYEEFISSAQPPEHADQCCEITHPEKSQHWHGPWDGDNKRALVTLGLLGFAPAVQTIGILAQETSKKQYEELGGKALEEYEGDDVVLAAAEIIMARDAKKKQTEDEIAALKETGKTSFESWAERYQQVAVSIATLAKVDTSKQTPELRERIDVLRNNLDYKSYKPDENVSESPYAAFNRTQTTEFTTKMKELREAEEIDGTNLVSTLILLHTDGETQSISEIISDKTATGEELTNLSSEDIALILSHEIEILTRPTEELTADDQMILKLAETLHEKGWYFINHGETAGEHTAGYHGAFAFRIDDNGNQIAVFDTCGTCTPENDAAIANAMDKIETQVQQIVEANAPSEPTQPIPDLALAPIPPDMPMAMPMPMMPIAMQTSDDQPAAPTEQMTAEISAQPAPQKPVQKTHQAGVRDMTPAQSPPPVENQFIASLPKPRQEQPKELRPKAVKPKPVNRQSRVVKKREAPPVPVIDVQPPLVEAPFEMSVPVRPPQRVFIQDVQVTPFSTERIEALPPGAVITNSFHNADTVRRHEKPRTAQVMRRRVDNPSRPPRDVSGTPVASVASADVVIEIPRSKTDVSSIQEQHNPRVIRLPERHRSKPRNSATDASNTVRASASESKVISTDSALTQDTVSPASSAPSVVSPRASTRRRTTRSTQNTIKDNPAQPQSQESSSSDTEKPSSPKSIDASKGASAQETRSTRKEQDAQVHAEELVSKIFEKREEQSEVRSVANSTQSTKETSVVATQQEKRTKEKTIVEKHEQERTVQIATDTQGNPIFGREKSSGRAKRGVSHQIKSERISVSDEAETTQTSSSTEHAKTQVKKADDRGTTERRSVAQTTQQPTKREEPETEEKNNRRSQRHTGIRQATASVGARTGIHDPRDVRAIARKSQIKLRTTLRDWIGNVPALDEAALRETFANAAGKTVKIAKIRTGRGRDRTDRWLMGDPAVLKSHKASLRKGNNVPSGIIELKLAA